MADDGSKRAWLGGIGRAYADRNFRIYSVGSIASWISFFVQLVAVAWLTWELTKSTKWLAIMALLDITPNVLLMPLAGALADRHDRHTIMLVTGALSLVQAAALAILAWLGLLTIWPLAVLVLLHGTIISFMVPAMYGVLPRFVERDALPSGIAVASAYTQFAVFAGPALGGWIIATQGLTWAFAVNAFGYAVLLMAFTCLRTPADYSPPEPSENSVVTDIAEGFAYIWRNSTMVSLLALLLVGDALARGFYQMLPAYSELILGLGVSGVSIIMACGGVGATVAALWLAHGGADAARVERTFWASLVAMLALAALIETANIYLAAVLAAVMGFAAETRRTSTMSIVQLAVDDAQRGRVMGTMFMLTQLAAAIGAYSIGMAAASHGLQLPIHIGVGIGLAVWLVIVLKQRLRK